MFFKTIEGFVEAGPQLALQLSLLLKGSWGESSFLVIGPILSEYLPEQNETETEITTTMLPSMMTTILPTEEFPEVVNNGSLVIFDRIYDFKHSNHYNILLPLPVHTFKISLKGFQFCMYLSILNPVRAMPLIYL